MELFIQLTIKKTLCIKISLDSRLFFCWNIQRSWVLNEFIDRITYIKNRAWHFMRESANCEQFKKNLKIKTRHWNLLCMSGRRNNVREGTQSQLLSLSFYEVAVPCPHSIMPCHEILYLVLKDFSPFPPIGVDPLLLRRDGNPLTCKTKIKKDDRSLNV